MYKILHVHYLVFILTTTLQSREVSVSPYSKWRAEAEKVVDLRPFLAEARFKLGDYLIHRTVS